LEALPDGGRGGGISGLLDDRTGVSTGGSDLGVDVFESVAHLFSVSVFESDLADRLAAERGL
jgi:hypothetical protein